MAKTKYFIVLNEEEKALLQQIIAESEDERLVMRARILLETDEMMLGSKGPQQTYSCNG